MQPTIGLTLGLGDDVRRSRVIEFAQRAEELGYDSLWVGEAWGRDLFTVLTHIACHTSRIKLATGIVNVYSRTPTLVAQSIASLDDISEGRAILGLGTSGAKVVEDWHGVPYEQPIQRTREYIEIVNLVLSGERVVYDGRFFKLRDFRLRFSPPRDRIPIYLASMGPKNVQLTGELADGWAPVFFAPGYLDRFRADLELGARRAGRSAGDVTIAPWMIACVSDDAAHARSLIRGHIAYYVGGMGRYYSELMSRYGFQEEAARIKELWVTRRDRDAARDVVTDAMVDAVAIMGNAARCRERIVELAAQGIESPVLMMPHGASGQMIRETVDGLAPTAFS